MNIQSGRNVYAAGGVLIFGWHRTNIWPAEENPATLKAPQKIVNASVGFQIESGAQTLITWEDATAFEVGQDLYHQVLLLRRKVAANSSAHGVGTE